MSELITEFLDDKNKNKNKIDKLYYELLTEKWKCIPKNMLFLLNYFKNNKLEEYRDLFLGLLVAKYNEDSPYKMQEILYVTDCDFGKNEDNISKLADICYNSTLLFQDVNGCIFYFKKMLEKHNNILPKFCKPFFRKLLVYKEYIKQEDLNLIEKNLEYKTLKTNAFKKTVRFSEKNEIKEFDKNAPVADKNNAGYIACIIIMVVIISLSIKAFLSFAHNDVVESKKDCLNDQETKIVT